MAPISLGRGVATLVTVGVLALAAPAVAQATERYVSNAGGAVGTPPGTGCGAGQAGYAGVQAAINASLEGDRIFICAGTYPGGYDLEGSAATGDLYFEGAGSGLTIVNGTSTSQLFGDSTPGDLARVHFTDIAFQNGLALDDDDEGIDGGGGAIGLEQGGVGSDVFVSASQFTDNVAQGSGGAIDALDVTISDSEFGTNRSDLGAGGQQDRGGAVKADGSLVVTGSGFSQNVGNDQGGAISAEGPVEVRTSSFTGNESGWDGGAIFAPAGLVLMDSSLTANVANDSGGGVRAGGLVCVDFFESPCPAAPPMPVGLGTSFVNNETEGNNGNGQGGGMVTDGSLYMAEATFSGNSATDADPGGGTPAPDGGGLFVNQDARVENSTFSGNRAYRYGGALAGGVPFAAEAGTSTLDLTVVDSTLSGNLASDPGEPGGIGESGGAISFQGATLELFDSILSGNSSFAAGAMLVAGTPSVDVDGSTFLGNGSAAEAGAVGLQGNLAVNFVDATFTENVAGGGGGAIASFFGPLNVLDSTFTGNVAGSGGEIEGGGAIAANGDVDVLGSSLTGNRAASSAEPGVMSGGAIRIEDDGSPTGSADLIVDGSSLAGNETTGVGGAIISLEAGSEPFSPTVVVVDSTVSDSDETPLVGGFYSLGLTFVLSSTLSGLEAPCYPVGLGSRVAIVNSTVSGNSGGAGGPGCGGEPTAAIEGVEFLLATSSTFAGNTTGDLLGTVDMEGEPQQYGVSNSIIDHAGTGCDFEGELLLGVGGNVITDRTLGCDSLVGGPPAPTTKVSVAELGLGPLTDNGGPTETMAIGPGSVAIDAGALDPDEGDLCDQPDQRGVPRSGGPCDAGAYEYALNLRVSKPGSGFGSVTSSPAGIECGASCAAPFDPGTEVTLNPVASPGSRFTRWSGGGCTGTGPCTVTVEGLMNVGAIFTGNGPGISIAPASRKSVRVRGRTVPLAKVSCSRRTCSVRNAKVTVLVGGKKYRAKPRFSRKGFPAGRKVLVSTSIPKAALARLRSGGKKGVARAVIVAGSERTPALKRRISVKLTR